MKKLIATSSILLGVVFLAGCGQQPVSQTQPITPAPVAQKPVANQPVTADLKTYQNSDFGFKFQYPSDKIGDNISSTELEIVNSIQQNGQVLRKDVDAVLTSDISSACKKAGSIAIDNGTCQAIKKDDLVILSLIDGTTVPEELVMATAKVFIISKGRVIMVMDAIKSETAIKYADLVTKFYKENPDVKQYDYQNKKWQAYRTQTTQALNGELNNAQSKEVISDMSLLKTIVATLDFTK